MNVHVAPAKFLDRPAIARAAFRASQGHRRRAHDYRRWAAQAEAAGKPEAAAHWLAEAKRADGLKWSDFETAVAYHG